MAARKKKEEEKTPLYTDIMGTKLERLKIVYQRWHGCERCLLSKFRLEGGKQFSEICFGEGNPEADILFIGEAPGEQEEASGIPFVGESGMLLNQMLANVSDNPDIQELGKWFHKAPTGSSAKGMQNKHYFHEQMNTWRHQEFFFSNVIACRPPENRLPTRDELKMCWERIYNVIYVVDPILIIAVGKTALLSLVKKQMEITKVRGQLLDCTFDGIVGRVTYPVMPILHPSFLLRAADYKIKGGWYEKSIKDLYNAMRIVDSVRQKHYDTPIPVRYGSCE